MKSTKYILITYAIVISMKRDIGTVLNLLLVSALIIVAFVPIRDGVIRESVDAPFEPWNSFDPSSSRETHPYNRQASYGYAYRWWDGANTPKYNDYSGSGGDCANFVSQCLIAGGISFHEGTDGQGYGVYPDLDRPSSSHGTMPYCDYMDQNLRYYQDTTVTHVVEGSAYVPDEVTVGDVVIFGEENGDKYKHAMVVVSDSGSTVGLAGHSSQVWDVDFFTEIGYSSFDCATFYHITDGGQDYRHFRITASALTVRVGPGLNALGNLYEDIGQMGQDEEYIAFEYAYDESGNKWWHFWFDDRAAWCAADYGGNVYTREVMANQPFEVEVSAYLNVRDGAGTENAVFGQVYDGMRFVSDSTDGDWYRFWYSGEQKWSHSGYVTDITETSQPPVNTSGNATVMGFLPYWVSRSINFTAITHLAWFSVAVNSDGTLANSHGWPETSVIDQAHNEGVKVVLTATMFDSNDIHDMLTSYKTACANNLLDLVQSGNADGICIDFEHPKQTGDGDLLVEFMDILNTTFKSARADYHVSLCTPSVDWWDTYDYGALCRHCDALMMMGYGYYYSGSASAGPTAPLEGGSYNLKNSVQDHLGAGAPASKLLTGLPFYGYDYPVEDQSKHSNTRDGGDATFYYEYRDMIQQYTPTVNYDSTYECPWFNYYVDGDGWHQVWVDNATSFAAKCDYALSQDLQGIGIWALGYDEGYDDLWQVLVEKFKSTPEVDNTPPDVTITEPEEGSHHATEDITIRWSGSDNVGIGEYRIKLDSGAWLSKTMDTHHDLTGLNDAQHTVSVMAVDTSENSAVDTVSFYVDTASPSVSILTPSEGAVFNTDTVDVWWSGNDNLGIEHYEFLYYGPGTWTSTGMSTKVTLNSLANGTYEFTARAFDHAGNHGDAVVNFTVDLSGGETDTIPPVVGIISPENGTVFDTSDVLVEWIGSDNKGISNYALQVDLGTWEDMGDSIFHWLYDLDDGQHEIKVMVTDTSGNQATAGCHFTVDTTPPEVIIARPEEGSILNVVDVTVSLVCTDALGISHAQVSLDLGPWHDVDTGEDYELNGLVGGGHQLEARTYDLAGNKGRSMVNFTLDFTAPEVYIIEPVDGLVTSTESVVLEWNASDDLGLAATMVASDGGEWQDADLASEYEISGLSPGNHDLSVLVTDLGGNDASDTVRIVVDPEPPEVVLEHEPEVVTESTDFTVRWGGTDRLTGIERYCLYLDGGEVYNGTGTEYALTSLAEGEHQIMVEACDLAGNVNSTAIKLMVVVSGSDDLFDIQIGPVTYEDGSPAPGALVTLEGQDRENETDDDGIAVLSGLGSGRYNVSLVLGNWSGSFVLVVYSTGHASYTLPLVPLNQEGGEDGEMTFNYSFGPIRDSNGNPVEGAEVSIAYGGEVFHATTNNEGMAVFILPEQIRGQIIEVEIVREGYKDHGEELILDPDDPENSVFLMETEKREGGKTDDTWLWVLGAVAVLLITLALALYWLLVYRKKGPGGGQDADGPVLSPDDVFE